MAPQLHNYSSVEVIFECKMCGLLPITRKHKPQLFDFSQGIDGIKLRTPLIFQDFSCSVIY